MNLNTIRRYGLIASIALTASTALTLAGCASTYRVEPARLIGSWQNRTVIVGQPGSSVITFRADGNFEEQRSQISRDTGQPLKLQGSWTLVGDRLRLFYSAGFGGQGTPEVDNRLVSRLSEQDFVSTDTYFRNEVWRTRVTPSAPATSAKP